MRWAEAAVVPVQECALRGLGRVLVPAVGGGGGGAKAADAVACAAGGGCWKGWKVGG